MGSILKDKKEQFEDFLRELLKIRYYILKNLDFTKLFDYEYGEQMSIVSAIRRAESKHYEALAAFHLASDAEKEAIFEAVLNKSKSAFLPGGSVDFLLKLTSLSEAEKNDLEREIGKIVNKVIVECMDITKLTNSVKRNYFNAVKITDGTIYIAVSKALLRLDRIIENEAYIYSWIKAETSLEAKKTALPITQDKISASNFVSLERTLDRESNGRSYHEMIGYADDSYEMFEQAELSIYRAKSLLEALEEIDSLQEEFALASERLVEIIVEMEEYFSRSEHEAVISLWNEFMDITTELLNNYLSQASSGKRSSLSGKKEIISVFKKKFAVK